MALNEVENGNGGEPFKGLYTWGRAKNYRLGRATDTNNVRRPELVPALAGIDVKQVRDCLFFGSSVYERAG